MTLEERVEQLETILMNLASRSDGLYVSVDDGNQIYSDTLLGYLLDNTNYKWKNLDKKGEKNELL